MWFLFGIITYAIKYIKYKDDWNKEGRRVFFFAVLIAALIFGPIGLLSTLLRSKGNPFKAI
jgi:branched-subunit amino acid ABC-type transport system permease component